MLEITEESGWMKLYSDLGGLERKFKTSDCREHTFKISSEELFQQGRAHEYAEERYRDFKEEVLAAGENGMPKVTNWFAIVPDEIADLKSLSLWTNNEIRGLTILNICIGQKSKLRDLPQFRDGSERWGNFNGTPIWYNY